MPMSTDEEEVRDFYALGPERILAAVESTSEADGTPRRTTGRVMSLDSLENRVYDIELADEDGDPTVHVVAKFYRPGRWTEAAIRAEHAFLAELLAVEIPAVAPLVLDASGATLHALSGADPIYFTLFPKVRGRATHEPDDEKLEILGRLIARLHNVGATHPVEGRARLDPATYGWRSLETIEAQGVIPGNLGAAYRDAVHRLLDAIEPAYARLAPPAQHLRIHADCHHGNLLWDAGGPFFLDFDDFTMGPAVQDLWLVAPGRDDDARQRRALLAEAYGEMRPFDLRTLELVEALRALRILRYAGWIAGRYEDPSFRRAFPDFHDDAFWRREVATLTEQLGYL